ncbi:hypothetical protein [Streptomyces chartreusis]|uniref:hypothetical protein n=1 Tax=Streptomyces chartreusis TaxID=1969 RepID=UPI002E198FD5
MARGDGVAFGGSVSVVRQEIRWWLTPRSADFLLIGWTDGTLVWDAERAAFDWALTDESILAQIRRGI